MRLPARGPKLDIAIVAVLAAYGTLVLATFWDRPYIAAFLLVPPPIILGSRLDNPRMATAMGLAGAILGPMTEMACVKGGFGPTPTQGAFLTFRPGTSPFGPAFPRPSGFWQEPF